MLIFSAYFCNRIFRVNYDKIVIFAVVFERLNSSIVSVQC